MKSHHVQRNQHHCSTFSLGKINWKVHPNIIMSVMARHFCHLCKVMFLNGAMWNIRLFPEPVGATIKKSWPLTNLSATVLWLSVISLKPSFLFLLVSIASYTFISYASFTVFTSKPSLCQGKDWPGSSFLKIDLTRKSISWLDIPNNTLGHHTPGQKTGRSNTVRCRREKSISQLTTGVTVLVYASAGS